MTLTSQTYQQMEALSAEAAAIRDTLVTRKDPLPAKAIVPGRLSETFTLMDPDLAALHSQMMAAAADYDSTLKSGGAVGISRWKFESLQSAFQTRLYELGISSAGDKATIKSFYKDREDTAADRAEEMQEAMNAAFNARRLKKQEEEKRRKEEEQGGWFFYMMLGIWLSNMNRQNRVNNMNMSKMHTDFFNALTG